MTNLSKAQLAKKLAQDKQKRLPLIMVAPCTARALLGFIMMGRDPLHMMRFKPIFNIKKRKRQANIQKL
jgi:hypothetical protein